MSGEDVLGEQQDRPVPIRVSPTVLYWGDGRHVGSSSDTDCHSQASGSSSKGSPSSSAPTSLDEWSERALVAGRAHSIEDWLQPSDRITHSCPGELWVGKDRKQFSFRPHRPDIIRTAQKGQRPQIPLEYTEKEWLIAHADDERVTIAPRWFPAQDAAKGSSTGSAGHRSHVESVTLWTSGAAGDTRVHEGCINRFPAPPPDWDWDRYSVVCPGLMEFELESSSAGANADG